MATSIFLCQVVDFPVRYLGIPLSISKLPKLAWQTLLDRITDRLPVWRGSLLRHLGRLILIKTTITAVPVYTCISLGIPPWLLKALWKLMMTFLWTDTDMVQGGGGGGECLMAWKRAQHPLHLGGPGVMDLGLLGIALRSRWLWLRYMDQSHPWASMHITEDN
jgi:hypothetical protein